MTNSADWKQFWEEKAKAGVSDFEVDRLTGPQDEEVERRAEQVLINFIAPGEQETVLDAGCGTGINILRLHTRVRRIIGIDYSAGSVKRCQRRMQEHGIKNAEVQEASVTSVPLSSHSVDRLLCMSVFHYLNDGEVNQALREFVRVLKPGGHLIFHVKNLTSPYWATLKPAKKVKAMLTGGKKGKLPEYIRPFRWYVTALTSLGCDILDYDSFSLLTLDLLPRKLVHWIRAFEIRHHGDWPYRQKLIRRHGAELFIKARVPGMSA